MELSLHPENPALAPPKENFWQAIGFSAACLAAGVYGFFQLLFVLEDVALGACITILLFAGAVTFLASRLGNTGRIRTARTFVATSIGGGLLVFGFLYFIIQGISAAIGFC